MFGSNYISQRNPAIHSQSSYESSYHPRIIESTNRLQNNAYPLSNSNISNQQGNSQNHNPILLTQFSNMNMNNNIGIKNSQQSFSSTNYINYKQFENIFIEKMEGFPNQVNDFLTKEEENINLKTLMNSFNVASWATYKNINKINETYCAKLSNSNCFVQKIIEICTQINELLNSIDIELLNQFNLLTSFHGYDESIQNEEKINLNKIQEVINECSLLLSEKIIKVNNTSMNYSNEVNNNCEQFKNILEEEMIKLKNNLNELIKYKNDINNNYAKYQQITNNIINSINSLKNKFIYINCDNESNNRISFKKENNNDVNIEVNNKEVEIVNLNKVEIDEDTKVKNRMATLKIISEMHNRNKKRKKKK